MRWALADGGAQAVDRLRLIRLDGTVLHEEEVAGLHKKEEVSA